MRYRFVDKIIQLEAGESIHCQYRWPQKLEIFQDHFPGFPVVPGVLLTEMMGQSSSLCIQSKYAEHGVPMLIQINKASFRQWVKPGELLNSFAEVIIIQKKIARVKVRTEKSESEVASAELLFTFETNDKLGLPEIDPILEEYLGACRT